MARGERLTHAHPRHPDTGLPDGFHGLPAGVCPWCSGDSDHRGEACPPEQYVRHEGPCPVWRLEFNEHGGIARMIRLAPDFKRLEDL